MDWLLTPEQELRRGVDLEAFTSTLARLDAQQAVRLWTLPGEQASAVRTLLRAREWEAHWRVWDRAALEGLRTAR